MNYRKSSAWQYPDINRQKLLECYIQDLTFNNIILKKELLSIRVMTYNIHKWLSLNGGNNYHHIERILRLIKPDIFAMQEYTEYKLPIFKKYNRHTTEGENTIRSNLLFDEITTVYGVLRNSTIVKFQNNLIIVSLNDTDNAHIKSILTILNNNYQQNPTIILGTFNCL
jgi:putative lipase involved disintegration of autophagic bodies